MIARRRRPNLFGPAACIPDMTLPDDETTLRPEDVLEQVAVAVRKPVRHRSAFDIFDQGVILAIGRLLERPKPRRVRRRASRAPHLVLGHRLRLVGVGLLAALDSVALLVALPRLA